MHENGKSLHFSSVLFFGLVCWLLWDIILCVITCPILFMHIYQIYKRIIFSLTFLDKPEFTCLHTVILGVLLVNT